MYCIWYEWELFYKTFVSIIYLRVLDLNEKCTSHCESWSKKVSKHWLRQYFFMWCTHCSQRDSFSNTAQMPCPLSICYSSIGMGLPSEHVSSCCFLNSMPLVPS